MKAWSLKWKVRGNLRFSCWNPKKPQHSVPKAYSKNFRNIKNRKLDHFLDLFLPWIELKFTFPPFKNKITNERLKICIKFPSAKKQFQGNDKLLSSVRAFITSRKVLTRHINVKIAYKKVDLKKSKHLKRHKLRQSLMFYWPWNKLFLYIAPHFLLPSM